MVQGLSRRGPRGDPPSRWSPEPAESHGGGMPAPCPGMAAALVLHGRQMEQMWHLPNGASALPWQHHAKLVPSLAFLLPSGQGADAPCRLPRQHSPPCLFMC